MSSDDSGNASKDSKNEDTDALKPETTVEETSDQSKSEAVQESNVESNEESTSAMDPVERIRLLLEQKLGLSVSSVSSETVDHGSRRILETVDFKGLIKHWKSGGFKKIITMVGAGISTSAGIPDFRSKGTGLYHNLKKYNLPYPTAIFEVDYFRKQPKPFFSLAKELYPGKFNPTPCHYFVKLLNEKGLLLRHYTQNIDTLERIAGVPGDKLVEAHGTFHTNHCINKRCREEYSMEWMKEKIFEDIIPKCEKCTSLVKPDIVFFGENLPDRFYTLPPKDFKECDLLIVMGTSLEVQPFASLVHQVNDNCVRLLINREAVGKASFPFSDDGFQFDSPANRRDVAWLGDCDDGVKALIAELDLTDDFDKLMKEVKDKK
ncbi:NAD-dependent protein deacetylase Sirt2 [Bradysia coprophila]|uniref:NAD-dependent protein deacetylase Sirt2 n=1 Tax=Bradysia coprophila TaxID=38358 RepID=UPI00187D7F75|nr:NAD-dependent protein deacetylase Sirt2 [Bradysia coprophila]